MVNSREVTLVATGREKASLGSVPGCFPWRPGALEEASMEELHYSNSMENKSVCDK